MYFRVLLLLLLIETLNNTEHYPALDFTAKTLYEYVLVLPRVRKYLDVKSLMASLFTHMLFHT